MLQAVLLTNTQKNKISSDHCSQLKYSSLAKLLTVISQQMSGAINALLVTVLSFRKTLCPGVYGVQHSPTGAEQKSPH